MSVRFAWKIVVCLLGITAGLTLPDLCKAQTKRPSFDQEVKWRTCCEVGGYTRAKALALAQELAKSMPSPVQMIVVSEHDAIRVATPDMTYELNLRLMMGDPRKTRLALFLKTPSGTAVDYWDGPDASFERRVIQGKNPFQLTRSIQLVRYAIREDSVVVMCLTSEFREVSEDAELNTAIRRLFPHERITVIVGDSPFYREIAWDQFLPIYGRSVPPESESAIHTRRWTLD
jgi:hypothetical protein